MVEEIISRLCRIFKKRKEKKGLESTPYHNFFETLLLCSSSVELLPGPDQHTHALVAWVGV